jgi:large subunit ribosomal protein L29
MKLSELRGKDSRELRLDIQERLKEKFQLRFKAANEEVANTARFRQIRREVAQINTVLRQREIEAGVAKTGVAKTGDAKSSDSKTEAAEA